jgi:hypothetical protein
MTTATTSISAATMAGIIHGAVCFGASCRVLRASLLAAFQIVCSLRLSRRELATRFIVRRSGGFFRGLLDLPQDVDDVGEGPVGIAPGLRADLGAQHEEQ